MKATHVLKKAFKDGCATFEKGTLVCVERSRVVFLRESGEVSIGSVLPGWADVFDIENFQPTCKWFKIKHADQ